VAYAPEESVQAHRSFGKQGLINARPRPQPGGRGRMPMQMPLRPAACGRTGDASPVRRKIAIAGKLTPVHIVIPGPAAGAALIHPRGVVRTLLHRAHGNVSFTGDDVSAFVHPAPGDQISRRCCSSLFAWPDESESEVTGGLLLARSVFRAVQLRLSRVQSVGELRNDSCLSHKMAGAK